MPYNSTYTYILVRIHGQSNHLGRATLASIPNSGMYAPYSGLSSSYQLKGTSSNSVKVWHESELKEATLENYNLNTLLIDSTTFTDHANRLTTQMGSWLSCINDVRASLDADGNNNDLIVYGNTRGGMSAVTQPASMSLDVDEFTRLGLNAFIEYVLSSGISNPYLIFSMNQGESDSSSPATAAAALVSWNEWQVDLKERFGYAPPFIVNSPDWDRADILASLETYITDNSNVYSSYGTTLADSIDEIESLHNATGVGTAIDKTNSGTYTTDGTHFNYAANIQSGKIEALRVRELATGFGD
jgi:hypothetical protein